MRTEILNPVCSRCDKEIKLPDYPRLSRFETWHAVKCDKREPFAKRPDLKKKQFEYDHQTDDYEDDESKLCFPTDGSEPYMVIGGIQQPIKPTKARKASR